MSKSTVTVLLRGLPRVCYFGVPGLVLRMVTLTSKYDDQPILRYEARYPRRVKLEGTSDMYRRVVWSGP